MIWKSNELHELNPLNSTIYNFQNLIKWTPQHQLQQKTYRERPNQKCSIYSLLWVCWSVVHNFFLWRYILKEYLMWNTRLNSKVGMKSSKITTYLQLFIQFLTIPIQHSQIIRTKVSKEVFIDKFIIDGEVMCVLCWPRFSRSVQSNKEQSVCKRRYSTIKESSLETFENLGQVVTSNYDQIPLINSDAQTITLLSSIAD